MQACTLFTFIHAFFFLHPATTNGDLLVQTDTYSGPTLHSDSCISMPGALPCCLSRFAPSVSISLWLQSLLSQKKKASRRKILNTDYTSLIVLPSLFQLSDPKGCWDPLLELLSPTSCLPPTHFFFLSGLPYDEQLSFQDAVPILNLQLSCSDMTPLNK